MTIHRQSQQAHSLLSTVVTTVPVVLFALDVDGTFLLSEGRGLDALGLIPGEVVGRSVFDVFADVPQIIEEAQRALAGQIVNSVTAVGDVVFEVRYAPVYDNSGRVLQVNGVAHNITPLANAEEMLRLRNRAIDASSVGITIADMRQPDQPLIFVNHAFEYMTGYTADEVIGRNCRFLQGDERDPVARDAIRKAIQTGEEALVVLRNYKKDGTPFWNELLISPIPDSDGHITHYVGFQKDVTDREEIARQLAEQNEQLLAANIALDEARAAAEQSARLKSEFLATMSHELRTPLNAIIGYTDILLAGMCGDLNDEQSDYQKRILANAESLLGLINNMLDISKIEAGRMEMIIKPFDLREWVHDINLQMQGLMSDKQLGFSYTVDERLPQQISADSARLRQIVLNLLSNAIKFTNEGNIRLGIHPHDRHSWKIVVSDTGIGIPSHLQEVIFEPFRQVDNSSARQYKGTGLGLAIVRKLALWMGGRVHVKSIVGEGSTFTIFLPLDMQTNTSAS